MVKEKDLINKTFYQTMLNEHNKNHPIQTLGRMYFEEMQKELPDPSTIRFSQGELYYLNNDYESAIYKWQHPFDDSFFPWAQKNIADAHLELGLFDYAENIYYEIETDSLVLKTEILLKLFSLYIQQENVEMAVQTIKEAVAFNPDYSDVTMRAKNYFESIQDWDSLIELSVNEAIRTESLSWFELLEKYVSDERVTNYEPSYFKEVLQTLLHINQQKFETISEALWNNYKQHEQYIAWLEVINEVLFNQQIVQAYQWERLPNLFEKAYYNLIGGLLLIREISTLVKKHLRNWLEVTSRSNALLSSTAVLAWNKSFPSDFDESFIEKAENEFKRSYQNDTTAHVDVELKHAIKNWVERERLYESLAIKLRPVISEIREVKSPSETRKIIQDALQFSLKQKLQIENVHLHEKEKHHSELFDLYQEVSEMEKEITETMTSLYTVLKNTLKEKIESQLPNRLQNLSNAINTNTDISKLHDQLNEALNQQIEQFMEIEILPELRLAFEEWMQKAKNELQESEKVCLELCEKLNEQYNEELEWNVNYKVLTDWERDNARISRGILRLRDANLSLRNNPFQVLLKGTSKLLGRFTDKEKLIDKYKESIRNADYQAVVKRTMDLFVQQLEIFEHSIEWDVNRFFSHSKENLHDRIEDVHSEVIERQESINRMREEPETYQDPLTLFKVMLRQYDLMNSLK